MSYIVRYSPAAMRDMEELWDGVFEVSRSFEIADRYVQEFTDEIAAKKDFPQGGIPLFYRGLFTGFYSVNFKAYKAFYRINAHYIEVARIIMMKRDYMRILFDDAD